MAPMTKHKPQKTNVEEEVVDLVIPYIHDVNDRSCVSLVSRKLYELDGITRKRLTVHTPYYPNPASLSKRFPFIESLTLKGPPSLFIERYHHRIQITPWIQQLALEFRCLKELCIRCMVVHDEDLETLARTRGKDLRSLKLKRCKGFSTDGLMHISMYCNRLRTFCLGHFNHIDVKDGSWLHQMALKSTVLERLHVKNIDISDNAEDLTLLAKTCGNSLISLKIGDCYLCKLGDAFKYAVRLEQFAGYICDDESDLVGFQFPLNIRSLSLESVTQYSSVLPLLNQVRKLKFVFVIVDEDSQCLLYKRCPNLEVLYTADVGDNGLQVVGQFCKKLRKLTNLSLVSRVGMMDLAKGCTNLECLNIKIGDISNEALECLGTQLKNLCKLRVNVLRTYRTIGLPLDIGILAMLMGCRKLERLDMILCQEELTDMGLEYIGKYGANLRSLSLTLTGNSSAGLVKLLEGCPRIRKLNLLDCPFREQAVPSIVFNTPSLRYVWVEGSDRYRTVLALIRPEFQI